MLKNKPSENNNVFLKVREDYQSKFIEYPLLNPSKIESGVYLTKQQYIFWEDLSVYLPYGCTIKSAYIRPEDHAYNGLSKLKELNSTFDFNRISINLYRNYELGSGENLEENFFKKTPTVKESKTHSLIKRTHPQLDGKFGSYYLHQFNYDMLQFELMKLGYDWNLPFSDDDQNGKIVRINYSNEVVDILDCVNYIKSICDSNSYLNIESVTSINSEIVIRFKFSDLHLNYKPYAILNTGFNSNVPDCFGDNVLNSIYQQLKINGYGDLEDSMSNQDLKKVPEKARKKGRLLARAIHDSMLEALGGSEGVVSALQSGANEYLMGLINGLISANKALCDEVSRLSGGDVSRVVDEAFESGMNRAIASKNVYNLLNNKLPIDKETGKTLLNQEDVEDASMKIQDIQEILTDIRNFNQDKS